VPAPGSPSIASIDPSSGENTVDTPVRIQGSGFHLGLSTDFDHDTTTIETASASIGTMPLAGLALRGDDLVEGTVPSGMPLGTYDVTVTLGTRTAVLPGGFTVGAEVLPTAPWGPPTLITELSSPATEDDPSITADRLELFFNSDRVGSLGGADIWVTTRASTADRWGTPSLVPVVNSTYTETTPKISSDGLTLYLSSDRPGGTSIENDVWVASRADRTAAWSTPVLVPELCSLASDTGANMSTSQLTVVLQSTRNGTGDIFIATRASVADAWSPPQPIDSISTGGYEADPCIAHQDRVVVFVSDRPDGPGPGDISIATRASAALPFDPPVLIPELNTPADEEDPFISDDLRYIMFSSSVSGDFEIYEASR